MTKVAVTKSRWFAVLGVAAWCTVGTTVAASNPPPTFTEEQASRGLAVYNQNCVTCHGFKLQGGPGGPPIKDATFRLRWQAQSAEALHTYIRTRMPPSNPGTLDAGAYSDLVAYILKGNGGTSGPTPLPTDAAQLADLIVGSGLPVPPPGPARPREMSLKVPPLADAVSTAVQKQQTERMQQLRPVSDEMLKNPPQGSWLNWRGTYDVHGFSALNQINRKNAARLNTAWSWSLPSGANEITPLVHDGIMFVASSGRVQALDAATGDLLWQYVREGAGGVIRNIAIYGERIFFPSGGHVIALDMRTGAVVWDRTVGDTVNFSGGPVIAKGKVMLGNTCGDPGGCFIVALDADSGKEAWRFYTIARPGQPGGDSWNGTPLDKRTGGSVWIAGSYDPDLDLVYFGTAQTYAITTLLDNATGVPGSNDGLFTNTTLAFRPETGELVWHYQHHNRDVWDLDWVFERTLATLIVNGKPRRTVTTAGKMGIFDTLDAATGEYLFSHDLGLQNLVVGIDPKTGVKKIAPDLEPKPNVEQFVCPSNLGGRDWASTAFNPKTGILYVPLVEACMAYMYTPGGPSGSFLRPPLPRPNGDGMFGRVQAFDLTTGKALWTQRRRAPQISGVLATEGGLIFEGSRDRWFRASDDRTGKVLWQTRLDGVPASYPITYMVDGVQYVAVTSGGGNPFDVVIARLTPEIVTPAGGTTLWIFRLPPR